MEWDYVNKFLRKEILFWLLRFKLLLDYISERGYLFVEVKLEDYREVMFKGFLVFIKLF